MATQTPHIHDLLIARCRNGDRLAQNEIYQLYARPMFNVSLRILQQREEAEDVLQEAFIEAFTRLHTFRGEASFGSWFRRIVVNRSINKVKKKKIRITDLSDSIPQDDQEEFDSVPENCTVDQVKEAVKLLPEGFRLVFTLYMFESFSHKEIARELGITESTSKSQLNRARKKLRELLTAGMAPDFISNA